MNVFSHPAKKRQVVCLTAFSRDFLIGNGGSKELSAVEIAYTVGRKVTKATH
jgi:hypothetical protein